MSNTFVKSLGLVAMVAAVSGVCAQCETDPMVELDQPTAQKNGNLVTITVTGLEGHATNQPPYDDYYLYAKLLQSSGSSSVNHPEIGPYGWQTDPYQPCSGGGFVKREYRGFSITFTDVPLLIDGLPDSFRVQVRSNEGEGFDQFYEVSPEVVVAE